MVPCQLCGQPATCHITDVVNKKRRDRHLCDGCARAHDLLPPGPADPALNLPALVALLTGHPPAAAGGPACPGCGLTFAAFRADGRLGCPADYDAFRPALEPLLDRLHRGTAHRGKVPRRAGRAVLRRHLAAAVAAEDYRLAARLRDRLNHEGAADEPG